jgi:hypothetical protein
MEAAVTIAEAGESNSRAQAIGGRQIDNAF